MGHQMRITLAQAFRVWTCWNLGFHCIGSLGRWLPFLVQGPMVFNVPHISEPTLPRVRACSFHMFHVFALCASACIQYFVYFYVTTNLGMCFARCALPHPRNLGMERFANLPRRTHIRDPSRLVSLEACFGCWNAGQTRPVYFCTSQHATTCLLFFSLRMTARQWRSAAHTKVWMLSRRIIPRNSCQFFSTHEKARVTGCLKCLNRLSNASIYTLLFPKGTKLRNIGPT